MIAQLMAKKAKSDRLTISIDSDLKRQFDTYMYLEEAKH